MTNDSSATIVSKVWNYAHVLKNAGVGYRRQVGGAGATIEVRAARALITYLLFGSDLRSPGLRPTLRVPYVRFAPILKLAPPTLKLRRAGCERTNWKPSQGLPH